MIRSTSYLSLLGLAGMACLSASVATAQDPVIDSLGFEAPRFSTTFMGTGQLEGQVADVFGGGTTNQFFQSGTAPADSVVVQDAIFASGSQAVQINRDVGDDPIFVGVPVAGVPAQRFVSIEFDLRVAQTPGGSFGPFFGVSAFDDAGDTGLLGSLGVDASTGDVLVQVETDTVNDPPGGVFVDTGTDVAFNVFNSFELLLDFQEGEFRAFLNDVLVAEDDFNDAGLEEFSDASIAALPLGPVGGPFDLAGTAFIDNYIVTEIPEPSTIALLALAAAPALGRKRR